MKGPRGSGGYGLVVNVCAFNSGDPSSKPTLSQLTVVIFEKLLLNRQKDAVVISY